MDMESMMGAGDSADQDEHYTEAEKLIEGIDNGRLSVDQRLQLATIHLLMSLAESAKVLADAEKQDQGEHDMGKGMMRGMGGGMNDMIRNYRG